MPKQELTGTLEEQCDFLYARAQEKIQEGNFTSATYALKEIVKYNPEYRDAAEMLIWARKQKTSQTNRLIVSLIGAMIFVGIGTATGVGNDLMLFGLALVGLLGGYGVANLWSSFRPT